MKTERQTRIKKNPVDEYFHPLPINVLAFSAYNFGNFEMDEVFLLNYLVVKFRAFRYKKFFHAFRVINEETGLKKSRLRAILKKFRQIGFVSTEVKGLPPVHRFDINFDKILEYRYKLYKWETLHQDTKKTIILFYTECMKARKLAMTPEVSSEKQDTPMKVNVQEEIDSNHPIYKYFGY